MGTSKVEPIIVAVSVGTVEVRPVGIGANYYYQDPERMKRWAKDLEEFLQGHTEYRGLAVSYIPDTRVQCSGCGALWDPMIKRTRSYCSYCGAPIK